MSVGRLPAGILLALVLAVSGCAVPAEPGSSTEADALRRVDEYVQQAMEALPAGARLEVLRSAGSDRCDDPNDPTPLGRVLVRNIYWVRDLPAESNPLYVDAMARWWAEHDFVILLDERPKRSSVAVENPDDGFRMAFKSNPKGELIISADSPCVWPDGTPAPAEP